MNKHGTLYTVLFAALVCLVCGVAVAASAVGLRSKQDQNRIIDMKEKVLAAAGLLPKGKIAPADVTRIFDERVDAKVVELASGAEARGVDPDTYDQPAATKDPTRSEPAPENRAKVQRLPKNARIYEITDQGKLTTLVLPVQGKGLWSTLYGFLALDADTVTIQGLIFYQHGETPGLGGEVDNPRWQELWRGRKAFDAGYRPAIEVIKGQAGPPSDAPHQVDGLSGATITSRGVTDLVQFWLGEHGYGPTLARYRSSSSRGIEDASSNTASSFSEH